MFVQVFPSEMAVCMCVCARVRGQQRGIHRLARITKRRGSSGQIQLADEKKT